MDKSPFIIAPAERQITSSRTFRHSLQLVWDAWTNPDRLKNWWGPNGFTNTFYEFDLKPGGTWRFTMHGPNNVDYPNLSIFAAVVDQQLLVWDHVVAPLFRGVAIFEANSENQTNVVYRMIFDDADLCNSLRSFIEEKNEENFDRLEIELQRDDFLYT